MRPGLSLHSSFPTLTTIVTKPSKHRTWGWLDTSKTAGHQTVLKVAFGSDVIWSHRLRIVAQLSTRHKDPALYTLK